MRLETDEYLNKPYKIKELLKAIADLHRSLEWSADSDLAHYSSPEELLKAITAIIKKHQSLKGCYAADKSQHSHQFKFTALSAQSQLIAKNSKLDAVFKFIEAHYHKSISLKDVAKALGYSPSYLARFVKNKTGETVNFWIFQRRMRTAAFLLHKSDRSVEQIATELGYQSTNLFFRDFRRHYDNTPQAWRNEECQIDFGTEFSEIKEASEIEKENYSEPYKKRTR